MITLSDIKKQAERWYEEFLLAEIAGRDFFPKEVKLKKVTVDLLSHFSEIRKWIKDLREQSKEEIGYGYLLEFVQKNNRKIGKQQFPNRIYFDNKNDYLLFINKEKEFLSFKSTVVKLLDSIPCLHDWILINPLKTIEHMTKWDDLIKVCNYFIANPKPNLYIRELPIQVHTKFIEENKAILRQLLDFIIPDKVNKDEAEFEKRFNLKYSEPLIRIRILDKDIAKKYFSGLTDLSILQSEFNLLNINCKRIFILENLSTFLTLPILKDSIAIFGKGFQIELLKNASWFHGKQIIYWGDIDVHGFQILSNLRSYFLETQSLMMDIETFREFKNFCVDGPEIKIDHLPYLTDEEQSFFKFLLTLKGKNRLEQEKISYTYFTKNIKSLNSVDSCL